MEKSLYFSVSWRDAAELARKLRQNKYRYVIKQMPGNQSLHFVFPRVSTSQYLFLQILFGSYGIDYQWKLQPKRKSFWPWWRTDG